MPKTRLLSVGALCAVGLSLAGTIAGPVIATATPGNPIAPPQRAVSPTMHPACRDSADLTFPVRSAAHPAWAHIP
ncbi:hypothetical protein [Mycobacterium sp.]|uniref:hypothetical protein n=1 Tax=Mycobacterium sp. TaxID=1785 RepID=UPI003BA944F9